MRNKYYNDMMGELENTQSMLMDGETIIWAGSPKKSAFILNKALEMLPIAIIWLLFDGVFIGAMFNTDMGDLGPMWIFLVVFFALHLAPVWIWLSNVLTAKKRWENTEYAVTDRRILLRNGLIGYSYKSIYYTDINDVSLHVGMLDKMLGVGDIYIHTASGGRSKNGMPNNVILDIENAERIYAMVQKTVLNIQTDIHYPNALRPGHNPGYNTRMSSYPNDGNGQW